MLEAITQKVDRSAVRHPNGEKVARSFADRPIPQRQEAFGKIEAHNVEMRAEEEQRSKVQKFMCRVTLMDVTIQFQRSKAKRS